MKKRSLKRGISLLTIAALMVGLFNGQDLFVKKLEAAETVEYNAKKVGVNILPAALKNNSDFMGKYVYKEGGFNITSEFKAVSSNNIKGGLKEGEALSTKRNYWHASNNHWEASFAFNFENEDEFTYLIDTGQINYGFRTYLRSDKHYHIGSPGTHDTQWDVAILTYNEGSIFAEAKDDMVGQETTRYNLLSTYTRSLKWKMWHGGCNCGSSGVSGSSIYVVDTKNPYVKSAYVTRDLEGRDVVNESEGFKADETGYFVLKFNENIRFGDNKKEELKLNLDLFYTDNNQSVTGDKVTASLVRLEDDKMIFKFTVPKKLNNKKTNVYIKSISTQQDWVGQGKSKFSYCVMDKNGKEYNVEDASKKYMTCGSRITDLAGNPVNWSSENLSVNKVYLDCKEPELGKVELSGSMITKDSRTDISQWQANIDRSAVFAGIGDTLNFTCTFTEELKINKLSNIKALLNIKDKDGNQVKITAKSTTNKNGRDVYGVDSAEVMVTSIDFSELLIEEGMEPLTTDGKSIQIIGFEGMSDVTDLRNNTFNNINNVSIHAEQQEYLDVLAPYVSTTMPKDVNYSDKYVPSSEGGFIFTVPITVRDDGKLGNENYCSGIYGLNGKFSLITEDNVKHTYEWYADNRASCNASNYSWKKGWTASDSEDASQNEFPQKGVTSYIHIKLNSAEEYAFDETYFNGTLQFETIDYAGNTKTTEIPIRHDVDNQGPSIEYRNAKVTKTAKDSAEMSLKLYVYDRFGVGDKITYSWYVENNNVDGGETNITGNDEIHSGEIDITSNDISEDGKNAVKEITIPFDILKGENNRGARTVNFTVADKKGNSSSYSKKFYFYFNEITSEYTISNNGSETDPLMKGKFNIVIKTPSKVTLDSLQAPVTARTMI
ncbi:MAG: hypothetical protein EGR71_02675 [Clostridiales bacterium]|nr:hypothetical protein [Clostridiales bacterium]